MSDIDLTAAITAAAVAIHAEGWTCEAHEPLGLDECSQCAILTPLVARSALLAALPRIRERIAAEIEGLPNLSVSHFGTRPLPGLIRKDTATRIARGTTRQETDHE